MNTGARRRTNLFRVVVVVLGIAGLVLAAATANWSMLTIVVPLLISAAWSLVAWWGSTQPLDSLTTLPADQGSVDQDLAVLIHSREGSAEMLVGTIASAWKVAGTVVLFTEERDSAALAARYGVTVFDPGVDSLSKTLPPNVDVLMPVDSGAVLRGPAARAAAHALRIAKAGSISGIPSFDTTDAYASDYAAGTLVYAQLAAREHGTPVWVDNATLVARSEAVDSEADRAFSTSGRPFWGCLLLLGRQDCLVTDTVLSLVQAPTASGNFWPRRLEATCDTVYDSMRILRSKERKSGVIPVLAMSLRGWPLLMLFLAPAALALSGGSVADRLPPFLWLCAAFAVPALAWAAHTLDATGVRGSRRSVLATMYEIPVSLAATRSLFSNARVPADMTDAVPVRLLTFMGLVSGAAGALGLWMAVSEAGDTDTMRVIAALLAALLSLTAMAAVLRSRRIVDRERGSSRKTCSVPVLLIASKVSTVDATVVNVSPGGAFLTAREAQPSEGDEFTVVIPGAANPVPVCVVRSDGTGFAVRADLDPDSHLAWVHWAGSVHMTAPTTSSPRRG